MDFRIVGDVLGLSLSKYTPQLVRPILGAVSFRKGAQSWWSSEQSPKIGMSVKPGSIQGPLLQDSPLRSAMRMMRDDISS